MKRFALEINCSAKDCEFHLAGSCGYGGKALSISKDGCGAYEPRSGEEERTFMVAEFCSHCETEIEMRWDTDKQGFKAFCPSCGQRLMLCDECRQLGGCCDYDRETDSCRRNTAQSA